MTLWITQSVGGGGVLLHSMVYDTVDHTVSGGGGGGYYYTVWYMTLWITQSVGGYYYTVWYMTLWITQSVGGGGVLLHSMVYDTVDHTVSGGGGYYYTVWYMTLWITQSVGGGGGTTTQYGI